MNVLLGVFGFIAIGLSDSAQEFAKHSNGSNVYDIITPQSCPTGLRETGYSWSIGGGIMLKERNLDGTTGDVCQDESAVDKNAGN
ncbi:MAG: hypothetical protein ACON49_09470 [Candidatus Puniceispirillaceae bacterium]